MSSLVGRYACLGEGIGEGVREMWLKVVQSELSLNTKFKFIHVLPKFRASEAVVSRKLP